jgi:hypothetical protein
MDDKHAPADVVGGAFLGTTVAVAFLLRAIPRHYRLMPRPAAQRALLDSGADDAGQPSPRPSPLELNSLPA